MTAEAPRHLIVEWLARSGCNQASARVELSRNGVALLRMGYRLAAIRLRGELVHAAAGTDEPEQVTAFCAELLDGPVIHDRLASVDATYYALINSHAGIVWDHEDEAPCLGDGVYLGVPAIGRVGPPGPYWLTPPRYDGDLCVPGAVAELVTTALGRLQPTDAP